MSMPPGSAMPPGSGQGPPPATPRQRTLPDAPVQLADDEVYVRKYQAVLAPRQSDGVGTLYVTNARVIFYAQARGRGTQRESKLLQQTRLQDITGVAAYVSYRLSLGLIVLTVLFALGFLLALILGSVRWMIIDAIVVAALLIFLASGKGMRGGAGVVIHSSSTETSPINFGSFAVRGGISALLWRLTGPFALLLRSYSAFDVAYGIPGADSDRVIAEIGALVLDMQQRGDAALDRWRADPPGPGPGAGMPPPPPPPPGPQRGV